MQVLVQRKRYDLGCPRCCARPCRWRESITARKGRRKVYSKKTSGLSAGKEGCVQMYLHRQVAGGGDLESKRREKEARMRRAMRCMALTNSPRPSARWKLPVDDLNKVTSVLERRDGSHGSKSLGVV